MPGADETARASDLSPQVDWPPDREAGGKGSEDKAPKARGFFLGQLPDDQPGDGWADEPPDYEAFQPQANFETELVAPVEIPAGESEESLASQVDEPIGDATAPVSDATASVPPVGGRETRRAARNQRARVRRSRVAVVVGVVAALVACTGLYIGTQAKAGDEGARRPTSTSFERQSSSTTGTTAGASDAAPATEPGPAADPAPGSAASGSSSGAPQGTSPTQTGAAGTGGGPASTSQPTPGSTGAPPTSASPPPRSPTCQLLPVLCP